MNPTDAKLPKDTLLPRPHIQARAAGFLIAERERNRRLELELARLQGRLEASERVERAAQRYADRLEERLDDSRKRESLLARAVGYLEGQCDELSAKLEVESPRKRLYRRNDRALEG